MNQSLSEQLRAKLGELQSSASPCIGAVAALQSDAGDIWQAGTGRSDVDGVKAFDTAGRFLIYSITKTFIAAAVLKLMKAGSIDLDVPFSTYLAEVPYSSDFTTRQLLNHTSGLPDYGSSVEYHEAVKRPGEVPWSFDEFMQKTLRVGLAFEPGRGWAYSNIGYMLLSRLIELATEQELDTAMEKLIFQPLKLHETFLVNGPDELRDLVPGYSIYLSRNSRSVDVRYNYDPRWVAHGVIASTVSEVVAFYQELFNGRLLAEASLDQMLKLIHVGASHPRFINPSYGLGIMADPDYQYGSLYGHTGEGPGYCGAVYRLRNPQCSGITVGVLCNSERATATERIVLDLLEIVSS